MNPGDVRPLPRGPRLARLAGSVIQALILGTLLFVAVCNLIAAAGGGARIFRYENF